ncbi:hypothetical protein TrispH2_005540 [Trichoplax sp. H2]|nr:hypothetical protein TrispH2_005540 [Trichoplax sp. H2]|eukprot:RDD41179.1 hypothetical protein TrispH2_005540 [Trichoplax sp. H2]
MPSAMKPCFIMVVIMMNFLSTLSKHRLLLYENRCFINETKDVVINHDLSLQHQGVAIIESLSFIHENSCYARCCNKKNCNVVTFHRTIREDGTHNCKLYHCPVISKCIFQRQVDHTVCTTGPVPNVPLLSNDSVNVHNHLKLTTASDLESSVTPTSGKQIIEDASRTISSEFSTNKTKIIIKKYDSTSSGSLIAVIFFGMLFLLIITGLIARRWLEFAQKRNYSKVDYLINDIYS